MVQGNSPKETINELVLITSGLNNFAFLSELSPSCYKFAPRSFNKLLIKKGGGTVPCEALATLEGKELRIKN
jgi:hypothetical protein